METYAPSLRPTRIKIERGKGYTINCADCNQEHTYVLVSGRPFIYCPGCSTASAQKRRYLEKQQLKKDEAKGIVKYNPDSEKPPNQQLINLLWFLHQPGNAVVNINGSFKVFSGKKYVECTDVFDGIRLVTK